MPTQLQDAVSQPISQNPPTRKPAVFIVQGGDLHIIFVPSASDGQPRLEYRDSSQTRTFSGDQVRTLDTDVGTLVTVTLQIIPDVGNTSFTLVVPRVNLQSHETQISTFGVTTHNRTPFILVPDQGQTQTYRVKELHGVVQAAV